jgi:hypothetical protein
VNFRVAGIIAHAAGTGNIILTTNKNYGDIISPNSGGISALIRDNVRIQNLNENRGNIGINAARSAGIVAAMINNTHVINNRNYGVINSGIGAGIVAQAIDGGLFFGEGFAPGINGRVTNNINEAIATINGAGSAGIIASSNGTTQIRGNINRATVAANAAAGIVAETNDNSLIQNNTNEGPVNGQDSSGIVGAARDNSQILGNTNTATAILAGNQTAGIINNIFNIVGFHLLGLFKIMLIMLLLTVRTQEDSAILLLVYYLT